MKRLTFLLTFLLLTSFSFAQDKVRVQIEFAKYRYTCPLGHKYLTDTNKEMSTCPVCGSKNGEGHYTEYHGVIYKTMDEYKILKPATLANEKQTLLDNWIYEIEHPAPYVEPTLSDLNNIRIDLINQSDELLNKIIEKANPDELLTITLQLQDQKDAIQIKQDEILVNKLGYTKTYETYIEPKVIIDK